MPPLMQSEQLLFQGDVQGVGFRYAFSRLAREQELAGWVRNLPDGSVEAVLQGGRDKIAVLMRKVMLLSGRVRITQVEQRKVELPPITGFSVR
ncbi:MAG: acylphosphatase [Candidatus Delongbacteria bacterium]